MGFISKIDEQQRISIEAIYSYQIFSLGDIQGENTQRGAVD